MTTSHASVGASPRGRPLRVPPTDGRSSPLAMARAVLLLAALMAATVAPGPAHAAQECDGSPEFDLGHAAPQVGQLVLRDGTVSQPFGIANSYGGWFTQTGFVFGESASSEEGCEVALEYLNLPAGVTTSEQMPPTVTLSPSLARLNVPVDLDATSQATLGDGILTVRATLGSQVRTIDVPFTVVDEPGLILSASSVREGAALPTVAVDFGESAEQDREVQMSSSDPQLAQYGNITVPEGSTGIIFDPSSTSPADPTAGCLSGDTSVTVTITASFGGVSNSLPLTVTPDDSGWWCG